jgi:predicted Zn-ribbon and HTH transcriptional regulator
MQEQVDRKPFECLRCGHKWMSYLEHPIACAKCKTPYWNIPRKVEHEVDTNKGA